MVNVNDILDIIYDVENEFLNDDEILESTNTELLIESIFNKIEYKIKDYIVESEGDK